MEYSKPRVEGLLNVFVASSRFIVRTGMAEDVLLAFRSRPRIVDMAPGFLRMQVLRPLDDPNEFWLMTWWADETSFSVWHRGPEYHASHAGIPKGLRLVPGSVEVRRLEQIAE